MKSTLPYLFKSSRSHSLDNPNHPDAANAQQNPRTRQGGIYNLNLTIALADSHAHSSKKFYNSKIITSVKSRRVASKSQIPENSQIYNLQNSMNISGRYSSLTSRNTHRTLNIDKRSNQCLMENSTYNLSKANSQGFRLRNQKVQEADNVKANLKKVQQSLYLLNNEMKTVPNLHEDLSNSIRLMGERVESCIRQMEKQSCQKVNKLKGLLSELRRQTKMEIKVSQQQLSNIQEYLKQGNEVLNDIESHREKLHLQNF